MGKGLIQNHIGNGQYSVEIKMNQSFYEKRKESLLENIEWLEQELLHAFTVKERNLIKLKIKSVELSIDNLENSTQRDYTITAWCADLSEELTGEVATVEVPGESAIIQIAPGFSGEAPYSPTRDGQLSSTMAMFPAGAFYNLAMLPGWQKWMPTFRHGTITELDGDNATVTVDGTKSSQQNLNINQAATLESVPIEYMECNGKAFEEGDVVLIKFIGQKWEDRKIVGFKSEPKDCGGDVIVFIGHTHDAQGFIVKMVTAWDTQTADFYEVKDPDGGFFEYPILLSEIEPHWDITKASQRLFDSPIIKSFSTQQASTSWVFDYDNSPQTLVQYNQEGDLDVFENTQTKEVVYGGDTGPGPGHVTTEDTTIQCDMEYMRSSSQFQTEHDNKVYSVFSSGTYRSFTHIEGPWGSLPTIIDTDDNAIVKTVSPMGSFSTINVASHTTIDPTESSGKRYTRGNLALLGSYTDETVVVLFERNHFIEVFPPGSEGENKKEYIGGYDQVVDEEEVKDIPITDIQNNPAFQGILGDLDAVTFQIVDLQIYQ